MAPAIANHILWLRTVSTELKVFIFQVAVGDYQASVALIALTPNPIIFHGSLT
jgi:hypothetical protein